MWLGDDGASSPIGDTPDITHYADFYYPGMSRNDLPASSTSSGTSLGKVPSAPSLAIDTSHTGNAIPQGIGASWLTLANDPNIKMTDTAIIDTTIRQKGGSRIISVEGPHSEGDVQHFNAGTGPLAKINHTNLPTIGPGK